MKNHCEKDYDMIYDVLRSKNEKIADAFFYVMMLLLTIERAFISEGTGAFIQYFILLFASCAIFAWRKYFGKLLFGALMRPGTISSWSRGHAEGLVKRMYEQLTRIGLKDESLQNAYALWLIESLELYKVAEIN